MKTKTFLWRRTISFVADLLAIYSYSSLLQMVTWSFFYIPFSAIFVFTFAAYYLLFAILFSGATPGRFLAGLALVSVGRHHVKTKALLWREVFLKCLIGIVIPFLVIPLFFPIWSVAQSLLTALVVIVISLLFLLIAKRQWWDYFSRTQIVRHQPGKAQSKSILLVITATVIVSILTITYPFTFGHQSFQKTYSIKYPATREVKNYSRFIEEHAQDPADYIFNLFKTHDIVVLSERIHSEYTQYDFIKKLVADPRFTSNVGNIFTECGSISFQDTLDRYLKTSFASERLLDSNTAVLQRNSNAVWPLWSNTNLFDLLKTVNGLNAALPDSSKVSWYFTDLPVDWTKASHESFIHGYTTPNRDSLMATHIIEPYKKNLSHQSRHKALVIMNSRHGYGLVSSKLNAAFSHEYFGTTAYLMSSLPGKVANVMLNTISIRYGYMMTPIQQGKWDRVFELQGNRDAGFNFAGSPFGEDVFDAGFYRSNNVRYKDVFTGFVFYKPLVQHIQKSGFPFEFDHFEDTILRRATVVSKSSVDNFRRQIAFYKQNPGNPVITEILGYTAIYNLVTVWGISFLLGLWWMASLVVFLFRKAKYISEKNKGIPAKPIELTM